MKFSVGGQGGQSRLALMVDHDETYGPHVMRELLHGCGEFNDVLDIGAGSGRDLQIAQSLRESANLSAVEFYEPAVAELRLRGIKVTKTNIEREPLPFCSESLDVIIANQVLEHTKEVFWIFHEMTRVLRVGGSLVIGVPNLVSFHNRLLAVAGRHATQHKMISAHVRPFSQRDLRLFLNTCFENGYRIEAFRGSQFYPFPRPVSRVLARQFPNAAFSIFFSIVKTREYLGGFLEHPANAQLETNFFVGQ